MLDGGVWMRFRCLIQMSPTVAQLSEYLPYLFGENIHGLEMQRRSCGNKALTRGVILTR